MQDHDDSRTRERAYDIWEREGRPDGRHDAHWFQAQEELGAAEAGSGPLRVRGPGPDSGLPAPPSASDRHLREAAERMRAVETATPNA